MLALRRLLVLGLLAASVARAEATTEEMQPLSLNGYQLIDAEYWTFVGDTPFHYPGDVLWGFYADGSSAAARSCALLSYRKLHTLFEANAANLRRVVDLGGTPRFYLWVNDYTTASAKRQRRAARLWHYNSGGTEDITKGAWEWEATVTQSGDCLLPDDSETQSTLAAAVGSLGG